MSNLIEVLKAKTGFMGLPGSDDAAIANAEAELCLSFAADYKEFLKSYGAVTFEGHEIFGLCTSPRLNVLQNTLKERTSGVITEDNLYVIEKTGMDGMVICQNTDEEIFLCMKNMQPKSTAKTLAEYVQEL